MLASHNRQILGCGMSSLRSQLELEVTMFVVGMYTVQQFT